MMVVRHTSDHSRHLAGPRLVIIYVVSSPAFSLDSVAAWSCLPCDIGGAGSTLGASAAVFGLVGSDYTGVVGQ